MNVIEIARAVLGMPRLEQWLGEEESGLAREIRRSAASGEDDDIAALRGAMDEGDAQAMRMYAENILIEFDEASDVLDNLNLVADTAKPAGIIAIARANGFGISRHSRTYRRNEMIKTIDHARQVATRRQAKGLRGLPRAVVRLMRARVHGWETSRAKRASVMGLPYNDPL